MSLNDLATDVEAAQRRLSARAHTAQAVATIMPTLVGLAWWWGYLPSMSPAVAWTAAAAAVFAEALFLLGWRTRRRGVDDDFLPLAVGATDATGGKTRLLRAELQTLDALTVRCGWFLSGGVAATCAAVILAGI